MPADATLFRVKTRVLTAQPLELDEPIEDLEARPLPKPQHPAQAIRDAFIDGVDAVALTDVPLHAADLRQGLAALPEADAVAWLDPRPLGPSTSGFRLREQWVPAHVAAVLLRRHTWNALGNDVRSRRVRAAIVELTVRTKRVGLDVAYRNAQASPGWSIREGGDVLRGWLSGFLLELGR